MPGAKVLSELILTPLFLLKTPARIDLKMEREVWTRSQTISLRGRLIGAEQLEIGREITGAIEWIEQRELSSELSSGFGDFWRHFLCILGGFCHGRQEA